MSSHSLLRNRLSIISENLLEPNWDDVLVVDDENIRSRLLDVELRPKSVLAAAYVVDLGDETDEDKESGGGPFCGPCLILLAEFIKRRGDRNLLSLFEPNVDNASINHKFQFLATI